jgi:hypothetical protein
MGAPLAFGSTARMAPHWMRLQHFPRKSSAKAAGVEFTNGDQPGVRMRKGADARN